MGPRALALGLPLPERALLAAVRGDQPSGGEAGGPRGAGRDLNIDDKLLGATRRHFRFDLDLVVTAQVRSYKPDPAHFKECQRRIGGKKGWVHIASGWRADIEPAAALKVPVIWVNRRDEEPDPGSKAQPTATCPTRRPQRAARLLAPRDARPRPPPDAVVVTSRLWQTNATALRAGAEAMLGGLALLPRRARGCRWCWARPVSRCRPCWPPMPTGTI